MYGDLANDWFLIIWLLILQVQESFKYIAIIMSWHQGWLKIGAY